LSTTHPARTTAARPTLPLRVLIRRLHTYLGAFIAPSVLFFAATGSLQLFSLHEAHGDYQPPAFIEKLGMLHKDQVFAMKPKRTAPPAAEAPSHRTRGTWAALAAGVVIPVMLLLV
jgi:hypothetical protein